MNIIRSLFFQTRVTFQVQTCHWLYNVLRPTGLFQNWKWF